MQTKQPLVGGAYIQPNNLKPQFDKFRAEYEARALEVLRGGWYILGKEVEGFEEEFSQYIGARHCVGLASGLDALWITFKLLDIGEGDEVIVCSNAYIACVMGITIPGASPVFVEPDEFYNIDISKIEAAITGKTKAILAVHLYGQGCDMDAVTDIARRYSLTVVEDCAQSHAARWGGKTLGTFGRVGCFSFYPTKGLGAFGDAGAIVTDDGDLAARAKTFRNYGSSKKYHFDVVGTNSRLDELQAAMLRVKLSHLDELNAERRAVASYYLNNINNSCVELPRVQPKADAVWHQFVVRSERRDGLKSHLHMCGVGTDIHYPVPPHLSRAYRHLGYREGDFPLAEGYARQVLSLPIYNGMDTADVQRVIAAVNSFG